MIIIFIINFFKFDFIAESVIKTTHIIIATTTFIIAILVFKNFMSLVNYFAVLIITTISFIS